MQQTQSTFTLYYQKHSCQ